MTPIEFENFCKLIEKVLYEITTIQDYYKVFDSLGIGHNGNRLKSACHRCGSELEESGYNVAFMEDKRLIYCHVCEEGFNLLTFIERVFETRGTKQNRFYCLKYICDTLQIPFDLSSDNIQPTKQVEYNWRQTLGHYVNIKNNKQKSKLTKYDDNILDLLSELYHESFINDNISIETMKKYNIKYYKRNQQIAIPIYSDEGDFVGIHARNLIAEYVEKGYKYIPLKMLNGKEYKFPTSMVLYGLYQNKDNIKKHKSAILLESPKSVMQLDTILENNISVGIFGMSLKKEQRNLLLKYEINTVYIALDRQYTNIRNKDKTYTKEFDKYKNKVMKIYEDLKPYVANIYCIMDNGRLLDYKSSPSDKGAEVWNKLMENKIKL